MLDVSSKTTGQLVDELVTNAFKTAFAKSAVRPTAEFDARFELLRAAVDGRFGCPVAAPIVYLCDSLFSHPGQPTDLLIPSIHPDLGTALRELCVFSLVTWQAQEVVVHETDDTVVAKAARTAQIFNAKRTAAIRQIDRCAYESEITITTKTYG